MENNANNSSDKKGETSPGQAAKPAANSDEAAKKKELERKVKATRIEDLATPLWPKFLW